MRTSFIRLPVYSWVVSIGTSLFAEAPPKVIFSQQIEGRDPDGIAEFVCLALETELSGRDDFMMLDRSRLTQSLEESVLREQSAGITKSALSILGGEVAIYPKVAQLKKNLYLSFRIVNLKDSSYESVSVNGKTNGDPMELVSDSAAKISEAVSRVSDREELEASERGTSIDEELPRFSLAIRVPESTTEVANPDPAADKRLTRIALDNGFSVIALSRPSQSATSITAVHLEGREHKALLKEAQGLGAEVIILGEAVSDPTSRLGAYHTAKARVELNAVDVDSSEVLATMSSYGIASDLSQFVAEKRAIEDATERCAIKLLSEAASRREGF